MVDESGKLRKLGRLERSLSPFIEASSSMTLAQFRSFLIVALNEGSGMTELAGKAGLSASTMSRHLLDLSDHGRGQSEGAGLIDRAVSPTELRKNIYTLTPQGRRLLDEVLSA